MESNGDWVHPSDLSRGSNVARKCKIWLWLRFVISNPHFKRGHEMRPHCVQSTHPMSEHCLYWLVEAHTASVHAARLKAVQVCLSDRTHTLHLLLLFFRCFSCHCCQVCLSIRVNNKVTKDDIVDRGWEKDCLLLMLTPIKSTIPYAQRILQVCFCPLDLALYKRYHMLDNSDYIKKKCTAADVFLSHIWTTQGLPGLKVIEFL